jgi:anti-sigma factor RsiW
MNQTTPTSHLDPHKLSAYIDGELPPAEQQGIEQHLAGCHACTLRVLSATRLKAATARAGRRFTPPADALARLTAQLQSQLQPQALTASQPQTASQPYTASQPQTASQPHTASHPAPQPKISLQPAPPLEMPPQKKPAPPRRLMLWTALAAAILLTVSLVTLRQLRPANPLSAALAAEALDQHLATLSSASTPQVLSTDRHTVKPWFQGRLPFSFNLPDASALPPDTTLKGADLTYLDHQPAALLLFTIHKHEVSIFLTERADASGLGASTFTALPSARAGFTLRTATTPDLRILAVSDVNPADLDNLVATLVQAQASLQISK